MTLKQMVEMVQQHHPKVGETQIKIWINQAQKDISDRTNYGITETSTFNTVSGTKYYSINAPSGLTSNGDVVTYNKVSYDGEEIQFIRNPEHIEGY
tara:strand:- start:436 stop:723 length:288 start_codon:yes stop_codon:yes gene_type:complete